MHCLTAIIVANPGQGDLVEAALRKIAHHAARHEPGTLGYHVVKADDGTFVTYERYQDVAAMEAHNNSAACAEFFSHVDGRLARVEVVTGEEIFVG